jgi:hypothetical protein
VDVVAAQHDYVGTGWISLVVGGLEETV